LPHSGTTMSHATTSLPSPSPPLPHTLWLDHDNQMFSRFDLIDFQLASNICAYRGGVSLLKAASSNQRRSSTEAGTGANFWSSCVFSLQRKCVRMCQFLVGLLSLHCSASVSVCQVDRRRAFPMQLERARKERTHCLTRGSS